MKWSFLVVCETNFYPFFVIFDNYNRSTMTKFVLEIKREKDVELIRAILRHFEIRIIEEEVQEGKVETPMEDFYNQFQFDLSNFKFDREEANAR